MTASREQRRPARITLLVTGLLTGLVAAGAILWALFLRGRGQPDPTQVLAPANPAPDPRLSYQGPFKNVHPDVPYVGDAACKTCHKKETESYSKHPMHLTLMPGKTAPRLPLDASVRNPFESLGRQFRVEERDGSFWHKQIVRDRTGKLLFEHEMEATYTVGSGARGHSYFTTHGGFVLQTPVSWYSQKNLWDLSPGFALDIVAGRRIPGMCLFCHGNRVETTAWSENEFKQPVFQNGHGIGCERCHGPGGEHIKGPGVGKAPGSDVDPTIVNPRHLEPRLREAVCWQCHLEGKSTVIRRSRNRFDFRPGMPLEDVLTVFHDANESGLDHAVNHVEQVVRSTCYQKSAGGKKQLGCISCHNPHEKPAPEQRVSHYRAACLKCHQETSCSLPKPKRLEQNKEDSCIACHMPRYSTSDIPHTASTDHRIPRRPLVPKPPPPPGQRPTPIRLADFVSFFGEPKKGNNTELERDRAVAATLLWFRGELNAEPLWGELEAAALRDPGDLIVQALRGLLLIDKNKGKEAVALFQDILAREPKYESGLLGIAVAYERLGDTQEAIRHRRRLVQLQPFNPAYRTDFLRLLFESHDWKDTAAAARDWLTIDPANREARGYLRDSLLRLGQFTAAEEQDRILSGMHR